MNDGKKAVVVIPVFKKVLTPDESSSLERCKKILNNHPIVFIGPKNFEGKYTTGYDFFTFSNNYFSGIKGYNALMLSSELYERFSHYEFMLIYQLDSLVFEDQLNYWCAQDWDYIGASWITRKRGLRGNIRLLYEPHKWRKKLQGKQNAFHISNQQYIWLTYKQVGNGGFSLRRTTVFQKLAIKYADWIKKIKDYNIPEDFFWGVLLNLYQPNLLKIAPYEQGIQFAFEMNPEKAYRLNGYKLPFGCHDYIDHGNTFWKKIFKEYGIE